MLWRTSKPRLVAVVVSLTAVTLLSLGLLKPGPSRLIPAILLLWVWPALTWSLILPGSILERLVFSSSLVLFLNGFAGLLLVYLPGPVEEWWLLTVASVVVLLPLPIHLKQSVIQIPRQRIPQRREVWALGLIIVLGIALRSGNFSYKELQGDEGVVLVRAAEMLTGDDSQVFLHQKGPMEILLPMTQWGIAGTMDDVTARLPFLWAGLLGLLAIYLLTRNWFGKHTALLAILFFSMNGFSIAFSRIVQYQALVILWSILALLAASRYRKSGRPVDLILAATFMAGGLLAHYDAILAVPALAWLLVSGSGKSWIKNRIIILIAASLAAGLILLFYAPYVFSETFKQTFSYLLDVRVGTGGGQSLLGWSGPEAWRMATFYNSTWYVLALLAFSLVGLYFLARRREGLAPCLFLLVPTLFYLVIVQDPRTHVYTIFPGLVIVGAYGATELWKLVANHLSQPAIWIARTVGAAFLFILTLYPYLLFVDVSVERQRNWNQSRPLPILYPVTWQDPPQFGLFGFPHQAGWRVVRDHVDRGTLPYASNEEEEITNLYMAQATRTYCPDYRSVIHVRNAQDEIPLEQDILDDLNLNTRVLVNGRPSMEIYKGTSIANPETVIADSARRWLTPADVRMPRPAGYQPLNLLLDGKIRILGYELDRTIQGSKDAFGVILYWKPEGPIERNYQVFVHLVGDELLAQHDGAPECAMNPTSHWEVGEIVRDPHIVPIPDEIPTGRYSLQIGMYDLLSEVRLDIPGEIDNSLELTEISINQD